MSRVPKEDPSGRSIILEEGEFQRIKVCFMMKAYEIHIKNQTFNSSRLKNLSHSCKETSFSFNSVNYITIRKGIILF